MGLAAFTAAKKSINLIRETLDTCEDISEISHHIADVFAHGREANACYQAQQVAQENQEAEAENVAPSESLQEAIDLVIHRRELAEMVKELEISLNYKWPTPEGEPTIWDTIKREQSRLQALKIKQRRERAEIAKREAEKAREKWKKIGKEVLKFSALVMAVIAIGWILMMAHDTGPIR